jgi:hypothetical protein
MSNAHDLEQIEISLKHAQKDIDLMKSLEKLTSNRDFKKVMLDGYFEKEAVRLVLLKADPSMQDEATQTAIVREIDSIGSVRQYLGRIMQMGNQMQRAVKEFEETREEILSEDAGDE